MEVEPGAWRVERHQSQREPNTSLSGCLSCEQGWELLSWLGEGMGRASFRLDETTSHVCSSEPVPVLNAFQMEAGPQPGELTVL